MLIDTESRHEAWSLLRVSALCSDLRQMEIPAKSKARSFWRAPDETKNVSHTEASSLDATRQRCSHPLSVLE
jgi:hypothetical protein